MWCETILWNFFLRRCVKITEFACHNKRNGSAYTLENEVFVACGVLVSCGVIHRVPKNFFTEIVSMKSHLLDGMLRFLKHAPALEIFGPKL